MERSEHGFDEPDAPDADESAEDFAEQVENDPARNPPDEDLEDVKGG